MSKAGDELISRLQKILSGVEPSTQPGRRCTRCRKDLSRYVVLPGLGGADVCNECYVALGDERYIASWNAAKPPSYDIDAILGAPGRKPYEITRELNSKIDPSCPESLLLPPELVVRDFQDFNTFEGHDLGYIIGRNSGIRMFLQGLRAMRAIGATRMVQFMTELRDFAIAQGVSFPDPLPDPWLFNDRIDSEMADRLDDESKRLEQKIKPYEGPRKHQPPGRRIIADPHRTPPPAKTPMSPDCVF